jgi:hypothetical protein
VTSHRNHMLLTASVLVSALCCSLAFAQEETAALNGRITDQDGLAVAGVKVQALNAATNVSYLADTNVRLSQQERIALPRRKTGSGRR